MDQCAWSTLMRSSGVAAEFADPLRRPEFPRVPCRSAGPPEAVAIETTSNVSLWQVGPGEVPIIVVGLVEKIEAVEAFDPADADANIESLRVGGGVLFSCRPLS